MSLADRLIGLHEDVKGLRDYGFKRLEIRVGSPTTVPTSNAFGLSKSTVIGWFCNKHNFGGWSIHNLSAKDKKEFGGRGVFRTLQDDKMTTSIIRFDFKKGTYAFLDNEAYENGDMKFEKMTPYSNVIIDAMKILKTF